MENFQQLISSIEQVHQHLQTKAVNAVNQALTMRNWLIGYYIVEFEQGGRDKADYGTGLLSKLSQKLAHIKGMDERSFRRFRLFYLTYPQLDNTIRGTVYPEFELLDKRVNKAGASEKGLHIPPKKIISKLSYSHIELLLNLNDQLKRICYELEWMKTCSFKNILFSCPVEIDLKNI